MREQTTYLLVRVCLSIYLFLNIQFSFAQTDLCGAEQLSLDEIREYQNFVERWNHTNLRSTDTIYLPIHPIIVRSSDGLNTALPLENINKSLSNINHYFINSRLVFYFIEPTYLDDDELFDLNYLAGDPVNEIYDILVNQVQENAINILYTEFYNGGNSNVGPYPGSWDLLPNRMITMSALGVSQINPAFGNSTNPIAVHEMGHFFSLLHTFAGTINGNDDPLAERVVRTGPNANCTTHGDLLCGTDANPRFGSQRYCLHNPNFTYSGDFVDDVGEAYIPFMDNIMSYNHFRCRHHLTDDQYERICAGYLERINTYNYQYNIPPSEVENPSNLVLSKEVDGIRLNWNDESDNEFGFMIERSETSNSDDFVALINGATKNDVHTFIDRDVQPNTTYWYRIKATNDDSNHYSNIAELNTDLIYCTSNTSNNGCSEYEIQAFKLFHLNNNEIINNSTIDECEGSVAYYLDECNSILPNETYHFNLSIFFSEEISSLFPVLGQRVKIWIDWNQDGFFEENEIGFDSDVFSQYAGNVEGFINTPSLIQSGEYRMRIRAAPIFNFVVYPTDFDACEYTEFGETEDYNLTLIADCPEMDISINYTVPNNQCLHEFIPTYELPNCYIEYENQWIIIYPDETEEAIIQEGNPNPISVIIEQYGLHKICLIMRLKGPNGEVCEYLSCTYLFNNYCKKQYLIDIEDPVVFPNPIRDKVNLRINGELTGNESMEIYNQFGILVERIRIGNSQTSIDVSQYLSGQYFIKINHGDRVFYKRFIKVSD